MLTTLRRYMLDFYYAGKRMPVPNSYILQHKSAYSIECFKLLSYLAHETKFFSPETKLFISTGMTYGELSLVMNRKEDTLRSIINKDKLKLEKTFGLFDVPCREYQSVILVDGVSTVESNLTAADLMYLEDVNSKLTNYLRNLGVSIESPEIDYFTASLNDSHEKIVSAYAEVERLAELVSVYSNPDNNVNIKLNTELTGTRNKYDLLFSTYEQLLSKLNSQTDLINLLNSKLGLKSECHPALTELLSFKVLRKPALKPFNPATASSLAVQLTEYVKLRDQLTLLFRTYSDADIYALDSYLRGVRPDDSEYCNEVTRVVINDWNMQPVNNVFINVESTTDEKEMLSNEPV